MSPIPRIRCCYKCTKRTGDCHSTCKEYKDEREALDEYNKEVRKQKELDRLIRNNP